MADIISGIICRDITDVELTKITDLYRQLSTANRYLVNSLSSLLLANQCLENEKGEITEQVNDMQ